LVDAAASPLAGKRIVVTRAPEQAELLCRELAARGAIPLCLPTVGIARLADFAELDRSLRHLAEFDWLILTSQNTVRALDDRCRELGFDLAGGGSSPGSESKSRRLKVAAVGPATAEAAATIGLSVDYVAHEHRGSALATELGPCLRGARVLLPHSDRAGTGLPAALRDTGAAVTDVVAYRTIPVEPPNESLLCDLRAGGVDVVTFFSPSAFHNLAEEMGLDTLRAIRPQTALAAIGPVTASAMSDAGLSPEVIASEASVASFIAALIDYFSSRHATGERR
jgi:uroporphyrinogen-III synthase